MASCLNFVEASNFFCKYWTSSQPPWSLWLTMSCRWFWRTNAFGLNDIAHFLSVEGALLRTILTWLKWKTKGKVFFFHCKWQDWLSSQCSKGCCYATRVALFEVLTFSRAVLRCVSIWQIIIERPWVRKISWLWIFLKFCLEYITKFKNRRSDELFQIKKLKNV